MAWTYIPASWSGGGDGASVPEYWMDDITGQISFRNPAGHQFNPTLNLAGNLDALYNAPGDGTPESSGMQFGGSNVPWAASPIMTAFRERELAQGNRDLGDYGGEEAYRLIQQLGPNAGLAEVNAILQQQGLRPFSSVEDWQSRNRMLPGHDSGSSFGDFLSGSVDHLGDTVHDLWSEEGFRNLALIAAGGAYAGSQYAGANAVAAPSGAAGGTAGGTGLSSAYAPTSLGGGGATSLGLGAQYAPTALGGTGASGLGLDASLATGSLAPGFFASEGLGSVLGGAATGVGTGSLLSGAGSLLGGIGDLWGGIKEYLPSGNTAAALAPIIAAIAYAKNQGPFDTSRLTSTYDQFEPDALAYEFDQNTNAGRNALTSSLTNRGVMGSSFGNMDLTNFQTTRDLGRRSLVNQGLAVRGGLANNILEAQVKERQLKNQLYGTSLLALGNVFGGRNQPTSGV
jgi:hypothetical protein